MVWEGGIFECAVADALHKKGYQLYFYKNDIGVKTINKFAPIPIVP